MWRLTITLSAFCWPLGLLAPSWAQPGSVAFSRAGLEPLKYNNPGLIVDLGVGLWAWPLPMDYDRDGDLDLVVSCPDVPTNATVFFENPGGDAKMPVFKPGKRIDKGMSNVQVCEVQGAPLVLTPGMVHPLFRDKGFSAGEKLPVGPNVHGRAVRANAWRMVDYEGDGILDLIVGAEDWSEYGWDNAFNERGEWTQGPLRGIVYLLSGRQPGAEPSYGPPVRLEAGGVPIDTFGMPTPNLADFDGDGDLDILCGEFVDRFTYFENVGTRTQPRYAAGRFLTVDNEILKAPLCMIVPVAIDWDRDGDVDLVVGQEDGRVFFLENTGKLAEGMPQFAAPAFFKQEADLVKFGALVTPVGTDWDHDGDEDLICGNTAGEIGFIENLGGVPPKWSAPVLLESEGKPIRIQAGPNGSVQGPCEAKWGYTTLSVADWDQDGLEDLVVNSIWGKVIWFRNVGTPSAPILSPSQPIEVEWTEAPPKPAWTWWTPQGKELATEWRTTPVVVDFNQDGLKDLVMLDHEGYLAFFERKKEGDALKLMPPQRIFKDSEGRVFLSKHHVSGNSEGPLQLNAGVAGKSGRRKLCMVDWDGDGKPDLLVDSPCVNVMLQQSSQDGIVTFRDQGPVDPTLLAGHSTSPTVVDWDRNGIPDLLIGAEDGHFYFMKNPRG